MSDVKKFWIALDAMGISYSQLSWDGYNVFGDKESIEEVKRMQHLAGTVPALRERLATTLKLVEAYEKAHDDIRGRAEKVQEAG